MNQPRCFRGFARSAYFGILPYLTLLESHYNIILFFYQEYYLHLGFFAFIRIPRREDKTYGGVALIPSSVGPLFVSNGGLFVCLRLSFIGVMR